MMHSMICAASRQLLAGCVLLIMANTIVEGQQTTGAPGSSNATTTIERKQLPPPDPRFEGVIQDDALQSKPWWPPRVVPPKGAPNVLLIITDDASFGVPGTFGGVIPTPTMDRIGDLPRGLAAQHQGEPCAVAGLRSGQPRSAQQSGVPETRTSARLRTSPRKTRRRWRRCGRCSWRKPRTTRSSRSMPRWRPASLRRARTSPRGEPNSCTRGL
jgi:hypothetical protein